MRVTFPRAKLMTGLEMSGLRLWISSLIRWPGRRLHEQIDVSEHWVEEMRENFEAELEIRARNFERLAMVWIVKALMLSITGIFFLIGLWLALAQYFGPVAGSFLLSATFVALGLIPISVLRKLLRG